MKRQRDDSTDKPAPRRHAPRERRPRAPAPRRLLAAAAEELVAHDGRLEMAAVASRAGTSVGLSYHYFGSKAGLLAAVVEAFYDRYDAAVIDLNPLPGAPWRRRERSRLDRMVDFYFAEPLAPLFLVRMSAEPEVAAAEARRIARHIAVGARNITLARRKGELPDGPDARLLVAMIMGGLRQAAGQALADRDAWPPDRLKEDLWGFVANAAGPGRDAAEEQPGRRRANGEGTL
jgi:AcrR family transcriptional regulator